MREGRKSTGQAVRAREGRVGSRRPKKARMLGWQWVTGPPRNWHRGAGKGVRLSLLHERGSAKGDRRQAENEGWAWTE